MSSVPVGSITNQDLDSTLRENRVFPPPAEFSAKAYIKSLEEYEAHVPRVHRRSGGVLGARGRGLHWFKPWDKVLEWDLPWAKWFVGGKINLCYNCVDRHANGERGRQDGADLGGRAGRDSAAYLCGAACGGAEVRECSEGAWESKRAIAWPFTWA